MQALVRPEWADRFDPGWFDPEFWGALATPVSSGGRGGAWFLSRPDQDWVLRHYLRGGMAARLSGSGYLFLGESRARSFAEFRLLQRLAEWGLPVPLPVAAGYRRSGLTYSAAIIVERLSDVVPWGDQVTFCAELDESWTRVGHLLRRFHDRGVDHADLNCFNILLNRTDAYLIDFDRGRIRQRPGRPGNGWQARNLSRLHRSLVKNFQKTGTGLSFLAEGWKTLLQAYYS